MHIKEDWKVEGRGKGRVRGGYVMNDDMASANVMSISQDHWCGYALGTGR